MHKTCHKSLGESQGNKFLTITPAVPCAPINQASKTENNNDVAIPPSNLPIIRIEKFLKSYVVKCMAWFSAMRSWLKWHLNTHRNEILTFGHATQCIGNCKEYNKFAPSTPNVLQYINGDIRHKWVTLLKCTQSMIKNVQL